MMSHRAGRVSRAALASSLVLVSLTFLVLVPVARAASGDPAWQVAYNGTGNGLDMFSGAAPAPSGGVFVVGTTTTSSSEDLLAARYGAGGTPLWSDTYDGPSHLDDLASAATTDRRGDLIVVGQSSISTTDTATIIAKYSSGGVRRWVRLFDDPGGPSSANGVAVDRAGDIYVLGGRFTSASGDDLIVLKYSTSGHLRWRRIFSRPANDGGAGIATDAAGNVYVTGFTDNPMNGLSKALTVKYDPAGKRIWLRLWNGVGGGAEGDALVVSPAGTVYVAGSLESNRADAVVLKYTSRGVLQWWRSRNGTGNLDDDYDSVALAPGGDVVATGLLNDGATGNDVVVTRLAPSGRTRWVRTYNGPDSLDDEGDRVSVAQSGAIYVAGDSKGATTALDTVTLKYGAHGKPAWAQRYTSAGATYDFPTALVVRRGAVYVAGEAGSNSGDALLLKYVP